MAPSSSRPEKEAVSSASPASGGVPTALTATARGSAPPHWPAFLPDGRRFLFHEGDAISLGSLDSADVRELVKADSQAAYSAAGHLLFMHGTTLLAQRFDVDERDAQRRAAPDRRRREPRAQQRRVFGVGERRAGLQKRPPGEPSAHLVRPRRQAWRDHRRDPRFQRGPSVTG